MILVEAEGIRVVRIERDGGYLHLYAIEQVRVDAMGEKYWNRVHTVVFDGGRATLDPLDRAWVVVLKALLEAQRGSK